MSRVLLVTNDFPPRRGGIQSYLEELVGQLVAAGTHTLTVYAPKWKGSDDFDEQAAAYRLHRGAASGHADAARAVGGHAGCGGSSNAHDIDTVWFGAAAPLALMAPLARDAGASRVIASTHGHEVGWSMLPLARTALRRIGTGTDVVTYVSQLHPAAGSPRRSAPHAALEHLPPGVDTDRFAPDEVARAELRARYRLGQRPVVVCVSRLVPRKGQDMLIRALPAIRQRVHGAALVIVGGGPYRDVAAPAGAQFRGRRARGVHRRGARRRTARPPRDGRRVRDAVPHPRRGAGRRGARHRLPGGVGDRSAGGGRPLGRRTGNGARRRDGRGGRRLGRRRHRGVGQRPARRSRTGRRGWARRAGAGWSTTGSGAPRPRALAELL